MLYNKDKFELPTCKPEPNMRHRIVVSFRLPIGNKISHVSISDEVRCGLTMNPSDFLDDLHKYCIDTNRFKAPENLSNVIHMVNDWSQPIFTNMDPIANIWNLSKFRSEVLFTVYFMRSYPFGIDDAVKIYSICNGQILHGSEIRNSIKTKRLFA